MRPRILALVFASGFCALVYQSVWMRLFRLIFGASTAANAAVLAIFMAGLGIGSVLLGKRADSHTRPLVLYGWIEVGIAVGAAISPLLVEVARAAYLGMGGTVTLGTGGGTVIRMLLALLVLAIPTLLMGGTLPALARALESSADEGRREIGALYSINTFGAVLGAFLTTFVLIEVFGVSTSLWLASGLNLIVGLLAVKYGSSLPEVPPTTGDSTVAASGEVGASSKTTARDADSIAPTWFVVLSAAVVGFVFFAMEIVWYRILAPMLGGSSFSFGLILVSALVGIAVGGWAYGVGKKTLRPTLLAFAATCAIEALVMIAPYAMGDGVAMLALQMRSLIAFGFWGLVAAWAIVTAIVVIPASIVAGLQFPLLIALLGGGGRDVGREVGLAYAANTTGAVLGATVSGFGLIALLGAESMWQLLSLMLVALALLAFVVDSGWRQPRQAAGALVASAIAVVLALMPGPSVASRHMPIGAGRAPLAKSPDDVHTQFAQSRSNVFLSRDGVESGIALTAGASLSLIVNGKSDGAARADAATMIMAPLLGSLLAENPQRGLIIGLGTGESAGWLAEVDTIEHVDCVELEPGVVEVGRILAPHNFDVVNHPKVKIHVGDGREFVLASKDTYDVIMSEPSNPYRAGVASLFSQDFYRSVMDRLDDDGVFVQWLQAYEVDARTVRSAIATIRSVFPEVEVWSLHTSDLALVARKRPRSIDVEQVRARLTQHPYDDGLAISWGTATVEGVLAAFIANDEFARRISEADVDWIDTDDQPVLEFGFGRSVGKDVSVAIEDVRALSRRWGTEEPAIAGSALSNAAVAEAAHVRWTHGAGPAGRGVSPPADDPVTAARYRARELYQRRDFPAACKAWREQPQPPLHDLEVAMLVECEVLDGTLTPESELLERLGQVSPTSRSIALARSMMVRAEDAAVERQLEQAFVEARTDGWFDRKALSQTVEWLRERAQADRDFAKRWFDVLAPPFAGHQSEVDRRALRVEFANYVDFKAHCAEAMAAYEPHFPPDAALLRERIRCYELTQHPQLDAARRDLDALMNGWQIRFDSNLP